MFEFVLGNIFDDKCDLLIIPCNSLGGVTGVMENELKENNIIYNPKPIRVGKVRFCPSNCHIASIIGFAASTNVLTLGSNKKYIKSICEEIKKYCIDNRIYTANIPLLGTGAGRLDPYESAEIFEQCFRTEKELHIKIFIMSKDVYQALSENIASYSLGAIEIKRDQYAYDIALSFAGEDRDYVEKIANRLKNRGIKVFYDKFEVENLFGKDLYQYLSYIYRDAARYCMIFISKYYKEKAWTGHELKNAQNRAFKENKEYILPIFLEDVQIEGLLDTLGHLKASEYSISEIVDITIKKLNRK